MKRSCEKCGRGAAFYGSLEMGMLVCLACNRAIVGCDCRPLNTQIAQSAKQEEAK